MCADEGDTRLLMAPTAGGALLLVGAGQQMTAPTAGGALLLVVAGQQRAGRYGREEVEPSVGHLLHSISSSSGMRVFSCRRLASISEECPGQWLHQIKP